MFGAFRKKIALFRAKRAAQRNVRQRPPRQEIVETMCRQPPARLPDSEIIRVVYSADREKRLIITRDSLRGYFRYAVEQLYVWSDEEWLFLSKTPDALPAMWNRTGDGETSFFGTEQEVWSALACTPEYRLHFGEEPQALDGTPLCASKKSASREKGA